MYSALFLQPPIRFPSHARVLLLASLVLITFWGVPQFDSGDLPSYIFLSPIVPPEQETVFQPPSNWLNAQEDNERRFSSATVRLPAGFTRQNGAEVFGDFVNVLSPRGLAPGILLGTEFALGIFTAEEQTEFEKPVELRFALNGAQAAGRERELVVAMFDPATEKWQALPTQFDPGRYQLVVSVQAFTPVPDVFYGWGGRTFLGIFPEVLLASDQVDPRSIATGPYVNRRSNLRAGPGTEYAVVGSKGTGDAIELSGRNRAGTWYQLTSGEWIAAFLVDNAPELPIVETVSMSTPTPNPTATPTPTPTPESSWLERFFDLFR